jgi:hypothetical protein
MLKLLRDDVRRLFLPARNRANSSRAALFREQRDTVAAIFGISRMAAEPIAATGVSYRGTAAADKMPSRFDLP